jgi:hypothetical protein
VVAAVLGMLLALGLRLWLVAAVVEAQELQEDLVALEDLVTHLL